MLVKILSITTFQKLIQRVKRLLDRKRFLREIKTLSATFARGKTQFSVHHFLLRCMYDFKCQLGPTTSGLK